MVDPVIFIDTDHIIQFMNNAAKEKCLKKGYNYDTGKSLLSKRQRSLPHLLSNFPPGRRPLRAGGRIPPSEFSYLSSVLCLPTSALRHLISGLKHPSSAL